MKDFFTDKEKHAITDAVMFRFERSGFDSMNRFSKSIGMSAADMTNLSRKKWVNNQSLVGEAKWVKLARIVGFERNDRLQWNTADTEVKVKIDTQLNYCRNYSLSGILVDDAGIGKSYACREYSRIHPNVFYIDCSNARTKNRFIRSIATAVGVDSGTRYDDMLADAIYALHMTDKPLLIFDEAGDLEDRSILEFKRMYNALEMQCGFYVVGSDGFRSKIERGIAHKKVGFTEVFSRLGKNFTKVLPSMLEEKREKIKQMAEAILKVNGITDVQVIRDIQKKLFENGLKDMRTVQREVMKLRILNQLNSKEN